MADSVDLTVLLCRWQAKQELYIDLMTLLDRAREERDQLKIKIKELESRKAGTNG